MKLVWINPLSTGSTSLDSKLNPHDVDHIALTHLLQNEGWEVWLQEAFVNKKKLSTWDKIVLPEELSSFEADAAIIACNPFIVDYQNYKYRKETSGQYRLRAKRFNLITDWLDKFNGSLYLFIPDPRPSFQSIILSKRNVHRIRHHLRRAKLLVADTNLLIPELRHSAAVSEYWKAVKVREPQPFCNDNSYFCVYPGLKTQNLRRKNQIKQWMDIDGCFTMGEIELQGIPSLTDHKKVPLTQVLDMTNRSVTSLICGEPAHTWLTPRVIQSLTCGTICSIHPEFAGSHRLPTEMVLEQTVAKASEFDIELSEKVYRRQVDFVESLYSSQAKSGVM